MKAGIETNNSGIIPTGGHVLVLPDKVEETTPGGLYYPEQTREKEQNAATMGTVIAIGASAWADLDDGLPWASVGDHVSYGRYAGVVMEGMDKENYVLINDNDILAVLSF
jgi:co-chaperonin GroES (HSP10)